MSVPPLARAIVEVGGELLILCPFCPSIHRIPASTGRLVSIESTCVESKGRTYIVGATMKETSFMSAIRGYYYDVDRKKKRGAKHKIESEVSSSG